MSHTKLTLAQLAVGQRFVSERREVTADEIVRYAREFDPQPFHTDPEAAKDTLFEGLAASGWHTAAMTMRLIVDGGLPFAYGLIGGGGEIVWPKPVRPGDTLIVESEIVSITPSRSVPGRAAVVARIVTKNQKGETVQSFSPKLLVHDTPPQAEG